MKTPTGSSETSLLSRERVFTATFLTVCFSTFAFFFSFQLLLTTLPLYIVAIGGKESDIGIVAGAFTITAVAARPPVGWAADIRGRRIFMLAGAAIFAVSALLYIPTTSIPWLLGLRLFHGVGIAAFTTGAFALVADISPIMRRGEAMGYFGMASNLALALAPALGIVLLDSCGFTVLFLISAGCAAVALALSLGLADPHRTAPLPPSKLSWASLFNRAALFPSLLVLCLTATWGAVVTFLPLYFVRHELGNPGLFFTLYAIVILMTRPVAGRLSDVLGRRAVILPGMLAVSLAMALLALVPSFAVVAGAAVLYGLGFGSIHPTLLAWVVDRAGITQRGAAMATFTFAFDVGIGVSSIILGFVLEGAGFATMWLIAAGAALLGVALTLANRQQKAAPRPEKV